jgi:hypothetical protein
MKMRLFLVTLMVGFFHLNCSAQSLENNLGFIVNVGFPVVMTSGTSTFALNGGINVEKSLNEKFSFEGQLNGAYLSFDRQDGIAHDGGYISFVTLNAGGRYYWNNRTENTPVFTNLMIGGGAWFEEEFNADNQLVNRNSYAIDLSSGTYVAIKQKVILGMAVDVFAAGGNGAIMLSWKAGYQF